MRKRRVALFVLVLVELLVLFNSVAGPFQAYASPLEDYDYVDNNTSDEDTSADKGTHSNFGAQQYGPDSLCDTLTEENIEGGGENWWNNNWAYRKKITFNNTAISEDLQNFPMPIVFDSSQTNFWNHVKTDGSDIKFIDEDNSTELHFEIEYWNNTSNNIVAWVKVPQVNASISTDFIWIYYGNNGANFDSYYDNEQVWDSNYKGVWHLNETSATRHDATSNSNDLDGIVGDPAAYSLGRLDSAVDLDGNDALRKNSTSFGFIDDLTLEFWIYFDTLYSLSHYTPISHDGYSNGGWGLQRSGDANKWRIFWKTTGGVGGHYTGTNPFTTSGQWVHVVCRVTNGIPDYLWVDGTQESMTKTGTDEGWEVSEPKDFAVGRRDDTGTQYIDGRMDEVRISNIARSAEWIEACYQYQVDQSKFTIGNEENRPNYELDLEIQWTNANYTRTNEELCIKTGTTGAEDIKVEIWSGSTWTNLITDLNANSWNNISVSDYLVSSIFTIRFKGGTETGDPSQDTWEIDCTLLHTWGVSPTASFSYIPEYPYTGETVTFNASDSHDPGGSIVSYFWDFGDGTNTTGEIATHIYTDDGTYTITLTVTDNDGASDTTSKNITVLNRPPTAIFTESAETAYTAEIITFNASDSYDPDGSIVSYYWDFGDGTNTTGIIVGYSYADDGTYMVTLTITDDDGATASTNATKTILNRPPIASFTESAETVYTDEPISFNASASYDPDGSVVGYFWDFGDGTNATGVVVGHTYADDGVYNVTLTVTDDDGGTASVSATKIILNRPPVASFTESAEIVLTGEAITFNTFTSHDPDGFIVSYFWDFGDGTNATGVVVAHTFVDDGVYNVTLTVTDNDGATDTATSTKTVLNRPPIAIFTESAETVNVDEPITLDAADSYDLDGAVVGYFWDFGDGTNATGVTVSHAYADYGTYTVTLTVTDDDGATASTTATKSVELHDMAITDVRVSDTLVYAGEAVTIEVDIRNKGTKTEAFSVSAYYGCNETRFGTIGTQNVTNLHPDEEITLTFRWNTTGVRPYKYASYTIRAEVGVVLGETRIADNIYIDGKIKVKIKGDINSDGTVDVFDLVIVARAYGSTPEDPNWDPWADLNHDNIIDVFDLVIVSLSYGSVAEVIEVIDHIAVKDGTVYHVATESNVTVSDFAFSQPENEISFNITSLCGTTGFCWVTIPYDLLGSIPYTVLIDGVDTWHTYMPINMTHVQVRFTCSFPIATYGVQIIGQTVASSSELRGGEHVMRAFWRGIWRVCEIGR